MADGKNDFCTIDDWNAPKWSVWNVVMWKVPNWRHMFDNDAGDAELVSYKTAWTSFNKDRMLLSATRSQIPADFLGCAAYNEVGGDPPWVKRNLVLPSRQFIWFTSPQDKTSEGAIKIKLKAALDALGMPDGTVSTHAQQNQLAACLETDVIVARFQRRVIQFDFPTIDTRSLTDEQFIISGSRYNRGKERALEDYKQSLRDAPRSSRRAYTEYGRAMVKHHPLVQSLLGL